MQDWNVTAQREPRVCTVSVKQGPRESLNSKIYTESSTSLWICPTFGYFFRFSWAAKPVVWYHLILNSLLASLLSRCWTQNNILTFLCLSSLTYTIGRLTICSAYFTGLVWGSSEKIRVKHFAHINRMLIRYFPTPFYSGPADYKGRLERVLKHEKLWANDSIT